MLWVVASPHQPVDAEYLAEVLQEIAGVVACFGSRSEKGGGDLQPQIFMPLQGEQGRGSPVWRRPGEVGKAAMIERHRQVGCHVQQCTDSRNTALENAEADAYAELASPIEHGNG